MSNIQYGYSGCGIIKPLPSTTTQVRWPDAPTYVHCGINTERETMSKPHTEQFARDLFGKMGAESSDGFGSFIDIIMELLPTILALFQDCPAADLKNAASGRWVPGKAFGLLRLRFGIRRSLGRNDDRAFGQQLNDAMIELVADSSVERLSGVLQEAQV